MKMITETAFLVALLISLLIALNSNTTRNRFLHYSFDIKDGNNITRVTPGDKESIITVPEEHTLRTKSIIDKNNDPTKASNEAIIKYWNYTNTKFPCTPESTTTTPFQQPHQSYYARSKISGLLYVKLLKTGSSTLAGINTRISINYAKRNDKSDMKCKSESSHEWYLQNDICRRNTLSSFLWTFVSFRIKLFFQF